MIYLLRHGLDDENYIGGWSDGDLINTGIEQVKGSIKILKTLNIKTIYSSDIKRAVTTSLIVGDALDIIPTYTSELRELNKGIFNGKTDSIKKEYPQYFKDIDIYTRYPEGECMLDLYKRIVNYIEKISEYDNILLITHRGVINMFYYYIYGYYVDMNKERFGVTHASIHEYDVKNRLIKKL